MIGQQGRGRIAIHDRYRLHDLDRAARLVLSDGSRLFDQMQKRRGAAVHDRDFRPIELDDGIIDGGPGECRHQVLDRVDAHAFAVRQDGRERGSDCVLPVSADLGPGVDPPEHDAGIGRRRP